MWQVFKNLISYLCFVLSLDWFLLTSTIIDILILVSTIFIEDEVTSQTSYLILWFGVFQNFVWQILNVIGHFSFLKINDPELPLVTMLKKNPDDKKDFNLIKVNKDLLTNKGGNFPYVVDWNLGAMENPSINMILVSDKKIRPIYSKTKRKEIDTYIHQYKDILLKFLNHRWYEIFWKRGPFTNDYKICFVSEIYQESQTTDIFKWRITKGRYYVGFLTNFIYSMYIGGSEYKLYPPINMRTEPIKGLGDSDLSNHIGVSTLLYTADGYICYFQQAGNAGYNAGKLMPTGSGSLDYNDYREGEDLRQMIIRGADRELAEESNIKKLLGEKDFLSHIHTSVIGFYRDMERGGKPEFCCVSYIDKSKEDVKEYIQPSNKEIAKGTKRFFLYKDKEDWKDQILPQASLSLKMNIKYLEAIMQ